jgi:ProP effector
MHDGIDKLAELFPHCFFGQTHLRRPLKIGIRDDIFARHPELQTGRIRSALRTYAQNVSYWVLLTAGTPRVDLDGNVAGEVTIEDEQDAQRKIAKAYRRTAAKEIEDRKKAESPAPSPQRAESPHPPADKPAVGSTPATQGAPSPRPVRA